MNIELIDDPGLIAMMGYPSDQFRTTGAGIVHQSDIIKRLMQREQPKRFGKPGTPFAHGNPRVEIGILFESILEEALRRKFATVRPAEIVSPEGVFMSPDGVNPALMCGEEYKATFMSSREGITDRYDRPLRKFEHWFFQVMGYAKWLEVLDWLFRVLFVNGNYNKSGKLEDGSVDPDAGPVFKTFKVRFTQDEVDENWQLLINVAKEEGML